VRASLVDYNSAFGLLRLCVVIPGLEICSDDPAGPVVVAEAVHVAGATAVLARVTGGDERTTNSYTVKVELF